jgi:hypothetical protein
MGTGAVSSNGMVPALLGGWLIVAIVILALLVGALARPGYRQLLTLVVMEGLLLAWGVWLVGLLA